ncbi:MAG: hypothetical protein QM757_44500, partial [Paludibaculum sp.]
YLTDSLRNALKTSVGRHLGHTIAASLEAGPNTGIRYFQAAEERRACHTWCIRWGLDRAPAGRAADLAVVPDRRGSRRSVRFNSTSTGSTTAP